jgi:hypothetical protein
MMTPLDVLIEALHRASDYNAAAEGPPEAVQRIARGREMPEPLK